VDQERDDEAGEVCLSCGMPVEAGLERAYAYGPSGVVCHACARQRGGVYDAARDCWSVEPDVADLPDERRPHG
jgi:hypothetical protein